jgi:hypothetical protein
VTGFPPDPEHFALLVQAFVGPQGAPGEEAFDFEVCTPSWLAGELDDRSLFPRHRLLLRRYDYRLLELAIRSLIQGTSGSSWQQVAERLARYGHWEFEDYAEAPSRSGER